MLLTKVKSLSVKRLIFTGIFFFIKNVGFIDFPQPVLAVFPVWLCAFSVLHLIRICVLQNKVFYSLLFSPCPFSSSSNRWQTEDVGIWSISWRVPRHSFPDFYILPDVVSMACVCPSMKESLLLFKQSKIYHNALRCRDLILKTLGKDGAWII